MSEMQSLVQVKHLVKKFPVSAGLFKSSKSFIHAVDDINFEIGYGSSLGLVGESGCGKTTTGKLLTRLYDPTSGQIEINDPKVGQVDLATLKGKDLKDFRGRVQIIFQDPYESLNPVGQSLIQSPSHWLCRDWGISPNAKNRSPHY